MDISCRKLSFHYIHDMTLFIFVNLQVVVPVAAVKGILLTTHLLTTLLLIQLAKVEYNYLFLFHTSESE